MQRFIRKKNRLPSYIYNSSGMFFITIATKDKLPIFGKVVAGEMEHNEVGKTVEKYWDMIGDWFKYVEVGTYVIMPNHFHGVLHFLDTPLQQNTQKPVSLGDIISRFKNFIRKDVLHQIKNKQLITDNIHTSRNPYAFWQKSYHDHVIRSEKDLQRIEEYIINNPQKREIDTLYKSS